MPDSDQQPPEDIERAVPSKSRGEAGATGLKRFSGLIFEEFLAELQGLQGIRVFGEMGANDAIVGATLLGLEMLIRSVGWRVEPGGDSPQDLEAADFLETARHDMVHTWEMFISDVVSMLQYGWAAHEPVYKERLGAQPPLEPGRPVRYSSEFDDRRIGWAKIPIRAQDSLLEWEFHPEVDELTGMVQNPPPTYNRLRIPITKLAVFRPTSAKGNPEGRSILRTAYRPWYFKRRIESIEAIGIERDLAGLPVAGVPAEWFTDTATPEQQQALKDWEGIVRDLRRDEMEGVVKPLAYDPNGNPLYTLELLSTGGSRQIDVNEVVKRKNQEIATAALADFIVIGHENVGSFALSRSKKEFLTLATQGYVNTIEDTIHADLTKPLLGLNSFNVDKLPRIVASEVAEVDVVALDAHITTLADVGFPLFPNEPLGRYLLEVANLPQPPDDEPLFNEEPDEEEEA